MDTEGGGAMSARIICGETLKSSANPVAVTREASTPTTLSVTVSPDNALV